MEEMYEQCSEKISIDKFVEGLVNMGAVDGDEAVCVLALNILARVCMNSSVVVISRIDTIIAQFEKLFKSNLKLVASKQS